MDRTTNRNPDQELLAHLRLVVIGKIEMNVDHPHLSDVGLTVEGE
jgi:hypothetical protein